MLGGDIGESHIDSGDSTMMKSMTAFSRAEKEADGISAAVEIRSYNSRHLDLAVHLSNEYAFMEDRIRAHISTCTTRGHVSVRVEIREDAVSLAGYHVDSERAVAYHGALRRLRGLLSLEEEVSLDHVLAVGDIVRPADAETDAASCWRVVEPCLHEAADGFERMRRKEGDFLAEDLMKRLAFLDRCVTQIEEVSGNLLGHYQERLKERIQSLTRDTITLDSDRITQEAAILADKGDISEEITRIKSHIKQFREIASAGEPAGRKLNFLLQEFIREFNTVGSKAAGLQAPYWVVDAKAEVEKMREQVQNVE